MISYFTGTVFILFYILFMYLVGVAVTENKKSYPTSFVYGYLIYSFFVAVVGIPLQIINLKWEIFQYLLIVIILILFIYSIYRIRKNKIRISISDFFRTQWVHILIAFILVFAACGSTVDNWLCNRLDDGFYLGIVAAQSETINGFNTNPATGFPVSSMGTYLFNTIFTEYSVFSRLFHIDALVLCHVFFAYFNYFLFCNVIHLTAEYCFEGTKLKATTYQYFSVVSLVFAIPESYMRGVHLLWVQDSWQFNTAMFYGSSIIRTMGSLLLILPFIRHEKVSFKDIVLAGCISIVLISKSSIALPVIIISCISYVLTTFLFRNRTGIVVSLIILFASFGVGYFLGNNDALQGTIYIQLNYEREAFLSFFICIVLMSISFLYKNRNINKLNVFIILMMMYMLVDPLNNLFETTSMYAFVAARMLAMLIYMIVILSFIYFIYGVYLLVKSRKWRIAIMHFFTICFAMAFGYLNIRYNGLKGYYLQYQNPHFIPESTIALGNILEERYEATEVVNYVIMPEAVAPYGIHHPVAVMLRTVSPHSVSISAALRYGNPELGEMKGYTSDDLKNYYEFTETPSEQTYEVFHTILVEYPVNCVITHIDVGEYLSNDGFHLFDQVSNTSDGVGYFVYVRD